MAGTDGDLNALKQKVFYDLMDLAGRVFILVRHSENVLIGTRGFLAEEKKHGIVLVFNSRMNFTWDAAGLNATLVFGTSPQKCFVPADDIMAVYSPELKVQFVTAGPGISEDGAGGAETAPENGNDKVVKVDFKKKKK